MSMSRAKVLKASVYLSDHKSSKGINEEYIVTNFEQNIFGLICSIVLVFV